MKLNRRDFVKLSSTTALGVAFAGLGVGCRKTVDDKIAQMKPTWSKETTSVCAYCSVGCGLVVTTSLETKRAINVEGNPDHPINEGSLCAKGASSIQMTENDLRTGKCLYRAPYSGEWEEKSWDWCKKRIAKLAKKSRDKSFQEKNEKGQVVNRNMGVACLGSAALDNEECYAMHSFMRSQGIVYLEHQARI